jgi:tyrosine phenol-lyase
MYFTTTRLHQELAGGKFEDIIIDEAHDPESEHPFKGNVDLDKLEKLVKKYGAKRIPYVSIATSVNMAGGQPISMQNLKELRSFTKKHSIRIIHDMTRVAENAFFIQRREKGYDKKSIATIVKEICSYTDGATMSAKKDALVNIGGFWPSTIGSYLKKPATWWWCTKGCIPMAGWRDVTWKPWPLALGKV